MSLDSETIKQHLWKAFQACSFVPDGKMKTRRLIESGFHDAVRWLVRRKVTSPIEEGELSILWSSMLISDNKYHSAFTANWTSFCIVMGHHVSTHPYTMPADAESPTIRIGEENILPQGDITLPDPVTTGQSISRRSPLREEPPSHRCQVSSESPRPANTMPTPTPHQVHSVGCADEWIVSSDGIDVVTSPAEKQTHIEVTLSPVPCLQSSHLFSRPPECAVPQNGVPMFHASSPPRRPRRQLNALEEQKQLHNLQGTPTSSRTEWVSSVVKKKPVSSSDSNLEPSLDFRNSNQQPRTPEPPPIRQNAMSPLAKRTGVIGPAKEDFYPTSSHFHTPRQQTTTSGCKFTSEKHRSPRKGLSVRSVASPRHVRSLVKEAEAPQSENPRLPQDPASPSLSSRSRHQNASARPTTPNTRPVVHVVGRVKLVEVIPYESVASNKRSPPRNHPRCVEPHIHVLPSPRIHVRYVQV